MIARIVAIITRYLPLASVFAEYLVLGMVHVHIAQLTSMHYCAYGVMASITFGADIGDSPCN